MNNASSIGHNRKILLHKTSFRQQLDSCRAKGILIH
jgi:hypothetical protein